MLCSLGSPAAISRSSGVRPLALRHTLSDALPLSSCLLFKKRQRHFSSIYATYNNMSSLEGLKSEERNYHIVLMSNFTISRVLESKLICR
jgi:hypothetical protein